DAAPAADPDADREPRRGPDVVAGEVDRDTDPARERVAEARTRAEAEADRHRAALAHRMVRTGEAVDVVARAFDEEADAAREAGAARVLARGEHVAAGDVDEEPVTGEADPGAARAELVAVRTGRVDEHPDARGSETGAARLPGVAVVAVEVDEHPDAVGGGAESVVDRRVDVVAKEVDDDRQAPQAGRPAGGTAILVVAARIDDDVDARAVVDVAPEAADHEAAECGVAIDQDLAFDALVAARRARCAPPQVVDDLRTSERQGGEHDAL